MDLAKYPLISLHNNEVLDRLIEECAELIHAASKMKRFNADEKARLNFALEIADVKACVEEVESRGLTK